MPRRKRTPEESGRRTKVSRVEQNEETLVISDSEQEEEDSSVKRSSRTDRCRRREIKSQIQEMTEDEMLDLAMRLSAQEASSAAQRQRQLEDSDIQKAIAESLNESSVQGSEGKDEAAGSSCPPQQSARLRRKLCYPSPDHTNPEKERETTSPLPEIPDLSQVASSYLSPRSSAQVSRTPANTQDRTSDKQTVISDTPEDECFKSGSESQSSPAITRLGSFIRRPVVCVEKLSEELILSSAASGNFHTEDGTDRFRSPQQDSPLSKWQVFTQNVFKRTSGQLKDKDGHQSANGNEDDTQIPDEDTGTPLPTQLSQGLSTCTDSCISPSRRSQISSPKCIPEDHKDVTEASKSPDQKQAADQATQGENVKSDAGDDADDEDDGSEEVLFPSPVKKIVRPIMTKLSPNQSCISSATITLDPSSQDTQMSRSVLEEVSRAPKGAESQLSDRKPPHTSVDKGQRTVTYYWGVPFCPMGLNPDEYTRVIMCQLEVYEKSLKEAQRKLLRKADWGQPVLPGSSKRLFGWRRLKRNRAPQLSEDEDENENEGEKGNNRKQVEEESEEARQEPVVGSQEDAEGGQSETYIVVSSPETKDEQVEKNPFFSQEEPVTADANQSLRKNTPWDISDEAQIKCPAEQEEQEAQTHEGCEEDEIICPETQMTDNGAPEQMMTSPASPAQTSSRADSELMEVEEGGGASVSAEEMMEQESDPAEAASLHTLRVECPICSKLFPNNRIELHAAYCDGVADQQEEPSHVVARRKRTRANLTEDSQRSAKSAEMEKCSLCQEMFSPQEYPEHVNLCFKKQNSRTNQENGLLSALERIERRHTGSDEPGPSEVSAKSNCGLADPTAMGSGDCAATTSCLTEAFTPRSENTDCLIDPSKNSQRLSRKRKFKK